MEKQTMKRIHYIVEDALINGGVGNYMCKRLIAKRLKNIIQHCISDSDVIKERQNIHVFVHDSLLDAQTSFIDFIGACLQKMHGKHIIYSSVHHLYATSGKTVVVLIAT